MNGQKTDQAIAIILIIAEIRHEEIEYAFFWSAAYENKMNDSGLLHMKQI